MIPLPPPLPPPDNALPAQVEPAPKRQTKAQAAGKLAGSSQRQEIDVDKIDPSDSAQLTPENMKALLKKASTVSKENVKKTRQAFDATKAAADSGLLKTKRFHK